MSVLEAIYSNRRDDVRNSKSRTSLSILKSSIREQTPPRDFLTSLKRDDRVAMIAEIKFRSPSTGSLHSELSVESIAAAYQSSGADALSVLTESRYFGGAIDHILHAKTSTALPVLRKDFLFDEYQIYEARAAGADAVLLIAAMLDRNQIAELAESARSLRMAVLLELHNEADLERCTEAGEVLWGVNHRNLETLVIDMSISSRLFSLLPRHAVRIAESGIRSGHDLREMRSRGADAVLVGTSLMKTANPGQALKALLES